MLCMNRINICFRDALYVTCSNLHEVSSTYDHGNEKYDIFMHFITFNAVSTFFVHSVFFQFT